MLTVQLSPSLKGEAADSSERNLSWCTFSLATLSFFSNKPLFSCRLTNWKCSMTFSPIFVSTTEKSSPWELTWEKQLSENLCFTIDFGTWARGNDGLLSSRQQLSAVQNWKGRSEQRKGKQLSHWESKQWLCQCCDRFWCIWFEHRFPPKPILILLQRSVYEPLH